MESQFARTLTTKKGGFILKKDDLATKIDNFQTEIWTEYTEKIKQFEKLRQEISDLDVTYEILTALLREVQYQETPIFKGIDLKISAFRVFSSHGNRLRFGSYKDEIKRTLEKKCDWIVLDTKNKIFRVSLRIKPKKVKGSEPL